MRRGCLIGLLVLVAVLIGSLVTVMILDRKYEFVRAARRVPHHELASPDMGLRVSIQPDRASHYLLAQLQSQQNVPEWAFLRVLPYEAAFMLEPKQDHIECTFYINAQRFGPQIAEYVRNANLVSQISYVQWQSSELRREDRGILLVKGALPIDKPAQEIALGTWRKFTPAGALELEGDHFFEAILDNRAGSGFVTLFSLMAAGGLPEDQMLRENLLTQQLLEARATADIVGKNDVDITIRLVYRAEGLEEDKGAIEFLYNILIGEIKPRLEIQDGVELEGGAGWEGSALVGRYLLKNADRLLH